MKGMNLISADPEDAHQDEDDARQNRSNGETVHTAAVDDPCNNGGKSRRGTGDLHLTSAEIRDDKARNDGGIDTLFRTDAGNQRQSNRERQRDDGDDDTCGNIFHKLLSGVAFQCAEQHRPHFFHFQTIPFVVTVSCHTGIFIITA